MGVGGGRKEKIKTFVKPHCFIEFHLKASSSRFFYNVVQEIRNADMAAGYLVSVRELVAHLDADHPHPLFVRVAACVGFDTEGTLAMQRGFLSGLARVRDEHSTVFDEALVILDSVLA